MKRILIIVTNHGAIDGEPRTGVWFSEFAEPYQALVGVGAEVTVASPARRPAPVDPRGYPSREDIAEARDALARLNATRPLDRLDAVAFDGVFVPGGHGPMFDLATDGAVKRALAAVWAAGRPVAAVCHGPAALLGVPAEGGTLLKGRRVTGFTHGEDAQDELFRHMPFSLQDHMAAEGAEFVEKPPRTVHVEIDGRLVTGQNPVSATATAQAFLTLLQEGRPMSRFALLAEVNPGRMADLTRLRPEHYRYLLAQQGMIVFGGPTRKPESGLPDTMIIVLEAATFAEAARFLADEPYNANGCFRRVELREWSQVLPEATPGALAETVAALSAQKPT